MSLQLRLDNLSIALNSLIAGSTNSFNSRAAFITFDVEPPYTLAEQTVELKAIEDTRSNTNRHWLSVANARLFTMNISPILTEAEQGVFNSAFHLLGENLAHFLLSGLGDKHWTKRRSFAAESTDVQGIDTCYKLEMLNESKQGLPIGPDPLVFAALLQILSEQQPPQSKVSFLERDVLTRLQWPQSVESRQLIKQSIERYTYTGYYLLDTRLPEEERINGQFSCCRRLLIGFDAVSTRQSFASEKVCKYRTVIFDPEFPPVIGADLKHFMGIDFKSLSSVKPVRLESFNFA